MKTIKKAMLLSAGFGKRMLPLTKKTPKPLIRVNQIAQIDYIVDGFLKAGINDFIVNTHYLGVKIKNHFKNHHLLLNSGQVKIISEDEILETGGGVLNAIDFLDHVFFVSNTDSIISDVDKSICRMIGIFDSTMDGLLLLVPKTRAIGYLGGGDFSINKSGILSRDKSGDYVFCGLQILRKSVFSQEQKRSFSLNIIYDKLLKKGRLKAYVHTGQWHHISIPSDVKRANLELSKAKPL